MKRILITGSNGLLGQKLIHQLAGIADFEIIATSRGDNRTNMKKGYTYESLDITNRLEVEAIFQKYQPNIIINTAAMTNVDQCEDAKEECWDLNVNAVKYLATNAEQYQSHLIHVSTDFIFDGKEGPYTEEGIPNPLSYYGQSKLAAEEIVQKTKTKTAIVRTVLVYGYVDNMSRSNIVLWAKGALSSGKEITVVNDQFRTPTLAEDLANGCVLIAQQGAEGIFNISGEEFLSVLELVQKVAEFYNFDLNQIKPITSDTLNQRAHRPPITGFILDKAKSVLGYEPTPFEEGLYIVDVQLAAAEAE